MYVWLGCSQKHKRPSSLLQSTGSTNAKSFVAMCKGQFVMVFCPWTEPVGRGPSRVLMIAVGIRLICIIMYTVLALTSSNVLSAKIIGDSTGLRGEGVANV